jgi:hypothetical protein
MTELKRLRRAAALADAFGHPHLGDYARWKIRRLRASGMEAHQGGNEVPSRSDDSPTAEGGDAHTEVDR